MECVEIVQEFSHHQGENSSFCKNLGTFVVFLRFLFQLLNMASCSTAGPLRNTSEKFEFRRQGSSSSESSDGSDYYVLSDVRTLAAKDNKLLQFLPHLATLIAEMESFHEEIPEGTNQPSAVDKEDEELEDDEIKMAHLKMMTAEKLENRSFIFKLWLRQMLLTREPEDEKDKNANLQDFEHAIYSAQEVIAEYLSFIYKKKENYNTDKLETMLCYYEQRLEEACCKTLSEKARTGFEMAEENKDRYGYCPNSRLCSLLGLRLDFLDRLKEISPRFRDHQAPRDWITTFLWNNFKSLPKKSSLLNRELLISIGFDPLGSAVDTILARANNRAHHIEACEWAERFINDEFKYNILLCQHSRKFPFEGNRKNEWFHLPKEQEPQVFQNPSSVYIMNLEVKGSEICQSAQDVLSDYEDDQHSYLFHGTDHESASNILCEGIDLCVGRQKRDFSSGSGFYLTRDLEEALNWAKSTTSKPAILMFKVVDCFDHDRKLSLVNDRQWRQMVTSFRMDNVTAETEQSLMRAYDFIEGPVATVTRNETSDELVLEPKPSSYQLCLISNDFADRFQQTLHLVLFYEILSD